MQGEADMRKAIIRSLTLVLTILAVGAMHASVAVAEENTTIHRSSRSGDMEFSLPIIYTDSSTIKGSGGSSVDLNADWSPGFGIGYHINEHVLVNGLFTWSSRGYDAETVLENGSTGNYNGTLDSSTISLNGTYFILDRDITPFVSGGIGWTYLDTNIPSGPSEGYCYWDPWWGYVCTSYVPTKSDSEFSFNAGLGMRWDITQNFSLQASYNKMWIDVSEASGGMPDFNVYKMDIIFRSKP
jgi:opacity protein-like surface antigen